MGKVKIKRVYSLLALLLGSALIGVAYTNCGRQPYTLYDSVGSLFQAPSEFSYSGNGGGYNGPHLKFEIIPPIDQSETLGLEIFAANVESSWRTCQLGDSARGVMGAYPKLQMQIEGIQKTKYCRLLDTEVAKSMFSAFEDPKFAEASGADPNFVVTYEFFKSLGTISTDITDEANRQIAYHCFLGYLTGWKSKPSESSKEVVLKSMALSSFDAEEDPPSELNTAIGNQYNLKVRVNFADDETPAFRLITQNGFPIFTRNDQIFDMDNRPIVDPEKYKARFVPIFPSDFGTKTPLFDTVSNQPTQFTVNQFDYMSCVQGELYKDSQSKGLIEQAATKSLATRSNAVVCEILKPWKAAVAARLSLNSWAPLDNNFKTVSQSWESEYEVRIAVAKELFSRSMKGEIDLTQVESCLSDTGETLDFMNTLRSVFYQETIGTFSKSINKQVASYVSALQLFDSKGAWTLFDLRGLSRLTPSEAAAGEHRRHQNIFMDFSKMSHNSWWVIFIHETLHRLDPELVKASYYFSTQDSQTTMAGLAAKFQTLSQLSAADRESVQNWIRWGFQRGLHSEYKAWLATFQLYQILVQEKLIVPVDWVESYLKGRNTQDPSFKCQLFSDLNKNSQGQFSYNLLNTTLMKDAISSFEQQNHQCSSIQAIKTALED